MVIDGFVGLVGLLEAGASTIFGSKLIFSLLLIVALAGILASIGLSFEVNFAVNSILMIGLAGSGWLGAPNMSVGLILVFVALMLTWLFSRIFG